jgi:hypothetical protein
VNKLFLTTAALLALAAPAMGQNARSNTAFMQMIAEVGCDSKYSDDKKADMYEQHWKGKQMTVTGEISTVKGGTVSVKILRTTLTSDVQVKMKNSRDAYDLEQGQRVTLTFNVSYHGGCILSFSGDNGVLGGTGF